MTLTTNPETPAATLLAELATLDVRLHVEGVTLAVDAPRGVLTAELLDRIGEHKRPLISLVRCQGPCDKCRCEEFTDHPIHGGRSLRRDCSRCGRTWGFPLWNPPK